MMIFRGKEDFERFFKVTISDYVNVFDIEEMRQAYDDFDFTVELLESLMLQAFTYRSKPPIRKIVLSILLHGYILGVQEKARAVATANSNHSKALKSARPTEPPQE